MLLVKPIACNEGLLFAMRLFVELRLEKFFILSFLSLLLFLHFLLPLLLQRHFPLPDNVLRTFINRRFGVLLIEEERMRVLHFEVGSLTELLIDDFRLLL